MSPLPNQLTAHGNNHHTKRFQYTNKLNNSSHAYIRNQNEQIQSMPYPLQAGNDLESRLNYISYQLAQVIQQNQQLLQSMQKQPEQSQTVNTPAGGTVIVRM